MALLAELPNELLGLILEHVPAQPEYALVCKRFKDHMEPRLYAMIGYNWSSTGIPTSDRIHLVARTLLMRPELGAYVKRLRFEGWIDDSKPSLLEAYLPAEIERLNEICSDDWAKQILEGDVLSFCQLVLRLADPIICIVETEPPLGFMFRQVLRSGHSKLAMQTLTYDGCELYVPSKPPMLAPPPQNFAEYPELRRLFLNHFCSPNVSSESVEQVKICGMIPRFHFPRLVTLDFVGMGIMPAFSMAQFMDAIACNADTLEWLQVDQCSNRESSLEFNPAPEYEGPTASFQAFKKLRHLAVSVGLLKEPFHAHIPPNVQALLFDQMTMHHPQWPQEKMEREISYCVAPGRDVFMFISNWAHERFYVEVDLSDLAPGVIARLCHPGAIESFEMPAGTGYRFIDVYAEDRIQTGKE